MRHSTRKTLDLSRSLGLGVGLGLIVGTSVTAACAATEAPPLPVAEPTTITPGAPPPFRFTADAQDRARATRCVASAVYFEAANQPREGREAVAQVILNRVRHPIYPKSVCGVVYQGVLDAAASHAFPHRGCQFTFACDGSTSRSPDPRGWRDAVEIADRALDGFVAGAVGASTHYHAMTVRPSWGAAMTPTLRIGAHQFYRFPGALGDVSALIGAYSGAEPTIADRQASEPRIRFAAAVPHAEARGLAAPMATTFSVWGVSVALATPTRGAIVVSTEP